MQSYRPGEFFPHLLLFARRLKERGLKITPPRVMDAARSLGFIDLSARGDFAAALRANFVSSREEQEVFDALFGQFFGPPEETLPERIVSSKGEAEAGENAGGELLAISMGEEPSPEGETAGEGSLRKGYSPQEILMAKDFGEFPREDTEILEREFSRLLAQLARKASRRREPSAKGRVMDFRRTLRRTVPYGGEILELVRRRPKSKPPKVIVICDVSGSMDASTRFILQFFFGMQKVFRRGETFVFSTRLTRITDILKRNRWAESLKAISQRVQDWSGGTQIGHCLRAFNERYARGLTSGSAVVILISDGWDRGDPELLDAEMKRLKRRARRVVWMNPLMATPEYRPICQGMRTALPYIDHFLPANTLKGLKAMGEILVAPSARG